MNRLINWFKAWLHGRDVKQINYLHNLYQQADKNRIAANKRLAEARTQVNALKKEFLASTERWETLLENAEKAHKQTAEALDATRAKLRIVEETTVPTLVQQHALLLNRYDAETAIQIRRKAAAQATPGEL